MARYYVLDRDFLNLGGTDCAPKVDDIDESSFVPLTRNNIGDFNGESVYRISQRNVELCGVVTSDGAVLVWGFGKVSI
jgi:hypothetical protein